MSPNVKTALALVEGLMARWSESEKFYRRIAKSSDRVDCAERSRGMADAYCTMMKELDLIKKYLEGKDISEAEE